VGLGIVSLAEVPERAGGVEVAQARRGLAERAGVVGDGQVDGVLGVGVGAGRVDRVGLGERVQARLGCCA
jgi:hypothetical protein